MKTNAEFKNTALAALKGNWAPAVLATAVFMLVALVYTAPTSIWQILHPDFQDTMTQAAVTQNVAEIMPLYASLLRLSSLAFLFAVFFYSVVEVGYCNAFVCLLRSGDAALTENMFKIAFKNYWHKVWGIFLMGIFIALWTCLFILPGIVKAFSYAMTPFILEDRPELSANEAIDLSRAMMKGHKFDLFYLYLGFIGWFLLCLLTLGIGFLWLVPYVQASQAAFYEEVKAEYAERAL